MVRTLPPVAEHFVSRQHTTLTRPAMAVGHSTRSDLGVSSRRAAGFLRLRRNPGQPVEGGHIMTADELKTLTTTALDQLATALDCGHSHALAAMLTAMSRFHQYSFGNVCLIASQRPTATRVAGFQTWKSL